MYVYLCYKENCAELAEEKGATENTIIFDCLEKATTWFIEQIENGIAYGNIIDENTPYRCLFGSDKTRLFDNLMQVFEDDLNSGNLILSKMYFQDEYMSYNLVIEKHEIQ